MKSNVFFILFLLAVLAGACGNNPEKKADSDAISIVHKVKGDSTIYGLACDGCTDSILVFLSYDGGDPDTFDIIRARQEHHIYGRPHIGDELAVLLNGENKREAEIVIDLNYLKGSWCYEVKPHFRSSLTTDEKGRKRPMPALPDSVKQRLMAAREYGFKLNPDYTAHIVGYTRRTNADEQSPVEYPAMTFYNEWRIFNGLLILTQNPEAMAGNIGKSFTLINDTARIIRMGRDTLVLQFNDHVQGYYKKDA